MQKANNDVVFGRVRSEAMAGAAKVVVGTLQSAKFGKKAAVFVNVHVASLRSRRNRYESACSSHFGSSHKWAEVVTSDPTEGLVSQADLAKKREAMYLIVC